VGCGGLAATDVAAPAQRPVLVGPARRPSLMGPATISLQGPWKKKERSLQGRPVSALLKEGEIPILTLP
jgi:hypothetical protein